MRWGVEPDAVGVAFDLAGVNELLSECWVGFSVLRFEDVVDDCLTGCKAKADPVVFEIVYTDCVIAFERCVAV